jgi:hypothetical protein
MFGADSLASDCLGNRRNRVSPAGFRVRFNADVHFLSGVRDRSGYAFGLPASAASAGARLLPAASALAPSEYG